MNTRIVLIALALPLLLAGGCGQAPTAPSSGTKPPPAAASATAPASSEAAVPMETLELWVSNQSPEIRSVDVEVQVDGTRVLRENFPVNGQHTQKRFNLRLSRGPHTLVARSTNGEASFETSFALTKTRYAYLSYWYYVKEHSANDLPRQFSFNLSDTRLGMD